MTKAYRRTRAHTESPRASTKLLRGFAISLSQKFETSYEYLMGAMWGEYRCRIFRLDLLTGEMWPKTCEERRNRILADKIVDNWAYLRPRFPHVTFTQAELVSRWLEPEADEPWIETRITFVADDGRRWSGGIRAPYSARAMSEHRVLD
ncbi:MAG TPA: hypothetical protein VFJ08_02640 [Salinisphaera sp.]|nr:hypothetical protein [Salinisphaera sp.]